MIASHRRLGLLFILVGPTGAGKNTIMSRVLEKIDNLQQLPTATTRGIRDNEEDGREHLFVTRDAFENMIAADDLLEYQVVHGNLYGVPRQTVEETIYDEKDRIADVDVLGATHIRSLYPDNVVTIFVQPPGDADMLLENVRQRLLDRGEAPEEIEKRLERVEMEMSYAPLCDYLIVNDDLDHAVDLLRSIIMSERSRRDVLNLRAEQELPRHRVYYRATIVVIHDDQILLFENALPTMRLERGELPHHTALRTVEEVPLTNLTPLSGSAGRGTSFVPPLAMQGEDDEHFYAVNFWYAYHASCETDLPEGWSWSSTETLKVPSTIRDLFLKQPRPVD